MDTAEKDARRALNRLRRALEKADGDLADVDGALRHAEGSDFPAGDFTAAQDHLRCIVQFVDEQEQRLQDKILHAGGLEPVRIRRGG